MKKIMLLALTALFLIFSQTACLDDDDSYSLGDFIVSFGLIEKTGDTNEAFRVVLDNGSRVIPVATAIPWFETFDGQRVLVNFTPLSDEENEDGTLNYIAKINTMQDILFKGILAKSTVDMDSIGNDPIKVGDKWISGNGILNFEISFLSMGKTHYINLVDMEEGDGLSAENPVVLELRHNNRGEERGYVTGGFVSFDLQGLHLEEESSVEVLLRYLDLQNETQEELFTYTYGE